LCCAPLVRVHTFLSCDRGQSLWLAGTSARAVVAVSALLLRCRRASRHAGKRFSHRRGLLRACAVSRALSWGPISPRLDLWPRLLCLPPTIGRHLYLPERDLPRSRR